MPGISMKGLPTVATAVTASTSRLTGRASRRTVRWSLTERCRTGAGLFVAVTVIKDNLNLPPVSSPGYELNVTCPSLPIPHEPHATDA